MARDQALVWLDDDLGYAASVAVEVRQRQGAEVRLLSTDEVHEGCPVKLLDDGSAWVPAMVRVSAEEIAEVLYQGIRCHNSFCNKAAAFWLYCQGEPTDAHGGICRRCAPDTIRDLRTVDRWHLVPLAIHTERCAR